MRTSFVTTKTALSRAIRQPRNAGVTLIELMVVVVIVGILAGISYPNYVNYMRQSKRSDAHIALLKTAAAEEKFYTDCNTYTTSLTAARPLPCAGGGLGFANDLSDSGYYQIQVVITGSGSGFTATANPVAGKAQASDSDCTSMTVNNAGVKSATGAKATTCWRK